MAKTRTLQQINQDYFQTAATLGDLIWKVSKFTGESLGQGQIEDLKRKLRTIDQEMDKYNEEEQKKQEIRAEEAQKQAAKNAQKTNGATPPKLETVKALKQTEPTPEVQ